MTTEMFSPLILMDFSMTHSHMTNRHSSISSSVGEVWSQTNWDPVWTGPNSAVPVLVWDFPKNTGLLGLWSGQSHIAQDCLRPSLDRDRSTHVSNVIIFYF